MSESGAPRAGTRGVYYPSRPSSDLNCIGFTVHRVEGNLCWAIYDGSKDPAPFIWRFRDGLNCLHEWPGKIGAVAKSPAL